MEMKVNLKNLEEGLNHLSWVETSEELDLDSSDVQLLLPAKIEMDLMKSGATLYANMNIETRARMSCSRCLEPVDRDLDLNFELIFK